MRRPLRVAGVVTAFWLAGCSTGAGPPPGGPVPGAARAPAAAGSASEQAWLSTLGRSHPLAGRIWDARRARAIGAAELQARLTAATFVLLGEVHDNPDHHRIRLDLLRGMVASGRRPALAMEQLDRGRQAAIDAARAGAAATAKAVLDAAEARGSGWEWRFYVPFVELALADGLPLVATNLSRADARAVAQRGLSALGAGRAEGLGIERVWSAARAHALEGIIVESHCGLASPELARQLAIAQRARDAVIADALVGALDVGAPAVLLAGNGHVRRDLGVPLYLPAHSTAGRSGAAVAVGFLEVREDELDPAAYLPGSADAESPFDFVYFTPAAEREDPCEALRRAGRLGPPPAAR